MAKEIERKFLVDIALLKDIKEGITIKQGYLPSSNKTVVRIRITDTEAFLTVKGENFGAVRTEFEYPIPVSDASQMMNELCERPIIEKKRYIINYSGFKWEVDIFKGENSGLIIAEIELASEDQNIDIPPWAGKEVTDDPRYYNSNLITNPYNTWKNT